MIRSKPILLLDFPFYHTWFGIIAVILVFGVAGQCARKKGPSLAVTGIGIDYFQVLALFAALDVGWLVGELSCVLAFEPGMVVVLFPHQFLWIQLHQRCQYQCLPAS